MEMSPTGQSKWTFFSCERFPAVPGEAPGIIFWLWKISENLFLLIHSIFVKTVNCLWFWSNCV